MAAPAASVRAERSAQRREETGEGLVELVPARGAVVRRLTLKDVADSSAVLKSLEMLAGRLAYVNGPEGDLREVLDLRAAVMERYAAGDRLGCFKLKQAVHMAIVALPGNGTLRWAHEAIQARVKRIRFVGNAGPENWAGAVAEHALLRSSIAERGTLPYLHEPGEGAEHAEDEDQAVV